MNVTSASFPSEAIRLIQNIADSRFIAFDFEFSGVAGRNPGGSSGKLTLQDYYEEIRAAAQLYQILQVGLTVVTEDVDKGRYVARPYNFNLSPLPALKESTFRRVWSYNSGAVSFLIRNGFNVELPLTQGVQYLSRQEEDEVRAKMITEDKARSKIPDMVLKEEDASLVDYIKTSVNEWQALPKEKQEAFLNIPDENVKDPLPSALNRYQIRLTHQIVRNEYPKLKTQGMGHFVQVTNPTTEQQANEQELREQAREREIANAVGFRWVLEAIMGTDISKLPHHYVRSAFEEGEEPKDIDAFISALQARLQTQTRAIVGHNCLTDVVNMYRCFIGHLPENVEDFKTKLHELFPLILDTKYLATLGSKRWVNTSLKAVEEDLSSEGRPKIHLPPNFDRYLYAANYHEAGFDSFVTAKIGLKLPAKFRREGKEVALLEEKAQSTADDTTSTMRDSPAVAGRGAVEEMELGLASTVFAAVTSPITSVKSLLSGQSTTNEKLDQSGIGIQQGAAINVAGEANENVLAVKGMPSRSTQTAKVEVKKLKSISLKSNIFDMLEDDPNEASQTQDPAEEKANELKRIAKMVEKGELLPRWEEDAALWKLIGNKLQANACQEGILDLAK